MATIELKYLDGRKRSLEVFRCRQDGKLRTESAIKAGSCAGHTLTEYVELGFFEKLGLMLGVIG